jgi:hypothetical protein
MATRRKKPKPMGCMEYLAVAGLLIVVVVGVSVVKAIAAIGTAAIILAVPIVILWLVMRAQKGKATARTIQADKRHEPAIQLLSALAFTDDRLSAKEKDVLTSYMRSYPDADPAAVFVRPSQMPRTSEIDRLIDRCQMTLSPEENDVLADHVRRLKATRRTHPAGMARLFDDADRRLARDPSPMPVVNDITEV